MKKKYVYRLNTTGGGSSKYGPCEVCKKKASEIFHLVQAQVYRRPDGSESLTYHECFDKYGHKECLAKVIV